MTLHILVDLSHGEEITTFPDASLEDRDFFVSYVHQNDSLNSITHINRHDLLVLGNPRPLRKNEMLFRPNEIVALKQFIYQGGRLLLTSSAQGNRFLSKKSGSLDVLYKLTGVQSFPYAILFHTLPQFYTESKRNIVIKKENLPPHPIFGEFTENDRLYTGLSGSTYLIPFEDEILDAEGAKSEVVLRAPENSIARNLAKKQNLKVNDVPLILVRYFGKGIVVSCAFSEFLKKSEYGGYNSLSGSKLFRGIINFLFG